MPSTKNNLSLTGKSRSFIQEREKVASKTHPVGKKKKKRFKTEVRQEFSKGTRERG